MKRRPPLIDWVFYFMEIWIEVKDFENYEISNLGNVRRKKCVIIYKNGMQCSYNEKFLNKEIVRLKYNRVTLSKNGNTKRFQIHRLVAIHFLENIEQKPCVNHIDGNGFNNNLSNLEWCTYSENERHSYDVLNKLNHNRKLNDNDILNIKNLAKFGVNGNIKKLSLTYNVNFSTIYNILKNKYYV